MWVKEVPGVCIVAYVHYLRIQKESAVNTSGNSCSEISIFELRVYQDRLRQVGELGGVLRSIWQLYRSSCRCAVSRESPMGNSRAL